MNIEPKCNFTVHPHPSEGKCWGIVNPVDEEDGQAIWRCEGHAEMWLLVPNENNEWIQGKYIPEHP